MEQIFEQQFPLAQIRESALNPRKTFNEARLTELADSIRQVGVTTPLLGRPVAGEKGMVELAAGHRRRRAAQIAGLEFVPVIIREYSDEEFVEVLTIENLQREDLHPMEEAEGFTEWLRRPGHKVAELAVKIGKSESFIHQRLRLIDLISPLREKFRHDEFGVAHAIMLARLGAEQEQQILADELFDRDGGVISIRALQVYIESRIYLDLAKAVFPIHDEKLLPQAGSCDRCTKRTGASPALFPEVQEKDNCLDRGCFYLKSNAHASAQVKRIQKESGEDVFTVSDHWQTKHKTALIQGQWKQVNRGKECGSTKAAVVVEVNPYGHSEFRVGETLKVCVNKKCRQHFGGVLEPAPRSEMSAAEQKKLLAQKEELEIRDAQRLALINAAVDYTSDLAVEDLLRAVTRVTWMHLWHDHQAKILSRRGIKRQRTRDGQGDDPMAQLIDTMSFEQLAGLLVEIAIVRDGENEVIEVALRDYPPPARAELMELVAKEIGARYDEKRERIDQAELKRIKATPKDKVEAKKGGKK